MTDQLKLLDDLLMAGNWSNDQLVMIAEMRIDVLTERSKKASLAEVKAEIEAELEAAYESLPPMVKLHPKTIDVSCPTCKVPFGKRCIRMTSKGPSAKPAPEKGLSSSFHKTRVAKAKGVS
jgi:hypothetical protein